MGISELLLRSRDRIIEEWVRELHTGVSPAYAAQPLETLRKTITAATDANFEVLAHQDFSRIDAVIDWIGRMRSKEGFSLSDVQKAFELYRTLLLPILARELEGAALTDALARLNVCLAYTLHRFSDYFQWLHEAEIRKYSQTLEIRVRKRTSQLTESESKYRTLVEKIRDGYFVNRDGRILFANKAFCAMHGRTKKEVVGKPFMALVAPESREKVAALYDDELKTNAPREPCVYLRLHKDGRSLPTESTVSVTPYQGKMAAIGICRDITERVEMERRMRESEGLARIGHLTTSLAHEIRNPLSSAKMGIQMILKNPRYEGTDRRRLEILSQQVSRLERIVSEMLDLARPMRFEFQPTEVTAVLEDCLEVLDAKLREKEITATMTSPSQLPPVPMDAEKIEQAVMNLLLNAIEAVDNSGRIHIGISHRPKLKAVEIHIEDDGCGVSEEDLPYIFDPFFSRRAKGTGLGLANARRTIEAHQGSLHATRPREGGMRFTIRLPLHHRSNPRVEEKG